MSVQLLCVKVGSKLRVRITSPGYKHDANCQFPRNLRVEGRRLGVSAHDITLVASRGSYFYRVRANNVVILDENSVDDFKDMKIFGDETEECVVCMSEQKYSVFGPCGHLSCCKPCANILYQTTGKCPMCRNQIACVIDYEELK